MRVILLTKKLFESYLTIKKVNTENVEQQKNIAFISINDINKKPFFNEDKKNAITLFVNDTLETWEPGAFTKEDAADLYKFIKRNITKEIFMIHGDTGIQTITAIASFIQKITKMDAKIEIQSPRMGENDCVSLLLDEEYRKDSELELENKRDRIIVERSDVMELLPSHPGEDGTQFSIPFDTPFKQGDIIWNGSYNCPYLYVESVTLMTEEKRKYYFHDVKIFDIRDSSIYHPKELLTPGIIFKKVQ